MHRDQPLWLLRFLPVVSGRQHLLSPNRLLERNDFHNARIQDQSRFGDAAMADMPSHRDKSYRGGRVATG
jgi:hypothetical protein